MPLVPIVAVTQFIGPFYMAAGHYPKDHRPDLENTSPTTNIGPFDSWSDPKKMVSIDPWGGNINEFFGKELSEGKDIRPTIAVTQAHLTIPEIVEEVKSGKLKPDGEIIKSNGEIKVTKVASNQFGIYLVWPSV